MAAEYCPDFLWSSSCLGPSGNWDIWTIQTDPADGKTKLYFFYLEEVKQSFLKNPDFYINQVM
jgi:hypothetical protein